MRMYEVLERSGDPRKGAAGDIVPVKEGFCWPALLFGPLWALYHRMWVLAAGLVSVGVIIALPPGPLAVFHVQGTAAAAAALLLGFHGNDLRAWSLTAGGFERNGVVSGASLVDAERRLFQSPGPMVCG